MSVDFPQPFGPRRPIRLCGVTRRSRCAKRTLSPYALPTSFASMSRFGFFSEDWKSRRTLCARFRSASCPTSASSAPALRMRACCFVERALAPLRSHSVSRLSRFLQGQLALRVRREALLLHLQVRRVVAADVEEAARVPPVELEDAVRDALKEQPVVRHRDGRVRRAREQLLEPEDRVHVEVVRRLVEEQEVRPSHELARERDALLPSSRERRDERPGRAALRHEREPGDVLVRREAGFPLLLAGVRARGALEDGLADRRALAEDRHLREEADAQAPLRGPRALVRRDLAREDGEQRRLPGAVRADEADAVARVDGARDPLEQGMRPERLRRGRPRSGGLPSTRFGLLASEGGRKRRRESGGADGARTRDLRRDRPAL